MDNKISKPFYNGEQQGKILQNLKYIGIYLDSKHLYPI